MGYGGVTPAPEYLLFVSHFAIMGYRIAAHANDDTRITTKLGRNSKTTRSITMNQVISNNNEKDIATSVKTLKALEISDRAHAECAVKAVEAGLIVFPIGQGYAAFTAARDAWKAAYGSTTVGNDHAFSRLMGEMKAGVEWKAPKSDNASAIAKARAKAKVSPAVAAANALLEKAKAAEKAVQAELKIQRGGVIKEVKKATKAQLDKIEEILNLTPARQLGTATDTKKPAAKKPAAK
jgi:hypothetical protein